MLGNFLVRTHWVPRLQNIWADDLSKGELHGFNAELQVHVDCDFKYALWFWNMSLGIDAPFPAER